MFVGPHNSRMCQYIIELAHQGQMIGPQSTWAVATTLELWIYDLDHALPFPSNILHFPLLAPLGLQFVPTSW
jgi:hypothetical protein